MPRRIGRPGLVGTMARTAVVAGTANATVGAMNRRQANKQAEQQAQVQQQAEQLAAQQAAAPPAPAPAPAAPAAGGDLMAQLQQLGDMKNAGLLSDEEFAAAKAKLLA